MVYKIGATIKHHYYLGKHQGIIATRSIYIFIYSTPLFFVCSLIPPPTGRIPVVQVSIPLLLAVYVRATQVDAVSFLLFLHELLLHPFLSDTLAEHSSENLSFVLHLV